MVLYISDVNNIYELKKINNKGNKKEIKNKQKKIRKQMKDNLKHIFMKNCKKITSFYVNTDFWMLNNVYIVCWIMFLIQNFKKTKKLLFED